MDSHPPEPRNSSTILILIGIISVLSISATYILVAEPLYLPLVFHNSSSLSPTATISPTQALTSTPQPPDTINLMVTPANPDKDWALAYFAKSYNAAGRPVMQIYPGDNSLDSDRIKISKGTIVLALKTPVIADGDNGKYWQLVDYKGRKGETLYLRAADVTKVTVTEP